VLKLELKIKTAVIISWVPFANQLLALSCLINVMYAYTQVQSWQEKNCMCLQKEVYIKDSTIWRMIMIKIFPQHCVRGPKSWVTPEALPRDRPLTLGIHVEQLLCPKVLGSTIKYIKGSLEFITCSQEICSGKKNPIHV
jgi:hypothetical protein